MKVFNPLASGKASGRALGGVFSFNRGLGTFKKYVKTRQPNTPPQQDIKTRLAFLTKYWKTNLTYTQITLWNNWVLPWTDIYGATVLLTGINKFVICNDTLLRAEKPITETPPTATPSELTITETTDTAFIKLSVNGIPDAEITAQNPFIKIEVTGTPQLIEIAPGQLDIHWNGMPRSRSPLKKNWKTVYFYDCRTGFDGIQELKIIIQTDTSLTGLQPIRLQRFNKWGYWSGKTTYINPIPNKNVLQNSSFTNPGGWALRNGAHFSDGKLILAGSDEAKQFYSFLAGRTYKFYLTIDTIEPGAQVELSTSIGMLAVYTSAGEKIETKTFPSTASFVQMYSPWNFISVIDDFFAIDIT